MKALLIVITLSIAFAACQSATSTNTHMNTAQNSNGSMNGMNHNAMPMNGNANMPGSMTMKSSPGAASQPFDLQFLDTMTEHHKSAIDMAKKAVEKTQTPS